MQNIHLKKALLILIEENKKVKNKDYRLGYSRALFDVFQSLEVIEEITLEELEALQDAIAASEAREDGMRHYLDEEGHIII